MINALKTQFNLGLMMFTETGGRNNNTDGGYVRFAIQPMTDANGNPTNARNCLLTMIGATPTTPCVSDGLPITYYTNLDIINDKSNGGKGGVTMGEAYKYFAGANAYAGNDKVKADPRGFISQTIAGPQYKSPTAEGCQKNFIIVLNNGPFSDNASDTSTATSQLVSAGGSSAATVINPPDNGTSNNNEADEWTRFLNKVPTVQAITYTLEVGPGNQRRWAVQHGVAAKHGPAGQRRLLLGNRCGDAEHGAHPNLQRHPGRQQRVRVVELAAVRRQHG